MKNNLFKKSVSVFLAVLMVMSCWVFAPEVHEHLEAEAAATTVNVTTSFTLSPNGNRGATDWTRLALTGESNAGGTSVVFFRFTNADLKQMSDLDSVNLQFYAYSCNNRLSHNNVGVTVNADIYYITQNSSFVSNQGTNKSTNVADTGNSVLGTDYTYSNAQNSAKSYFGLSDTTLVGSFEQPAINGQDNASLRTGDANYSYPVTDIVKEKAASDEDLCFIVMLRQGYSCSGDRGWSDIYIDSDTISLSGYNALEELKSKIEAYEGYFSNGIFYTNLQNNYKAYNDAKRYYDAVTYGGVQFDAAVAQGYMNAIDTAIANTGRNDTYVDYLNTNITSRDGSAVSAAYRKNVIWYPWDFSWDITNNNARPEIQDTYFYFTMPNTIVGITSDSETTFPLHSFFWTSTSSRYVRYVIAGSGTISSGVVGSSDFSTMAPWKISNDSNRHTTSGLNPGTDGFGGWVFESNYRTDVTLDNFEDNSSNFSYSQSQVYQISSYAQINKSSIGVNASNVYKKVDQGFTFATAKSANGGSTNYGNHYASNYSNYGGYLYVVYMDTYKNNYQNWKTLIPAISYKDYNGFVYSDATNVTKHLDYASEIPLNLNLTEANRVGDISATVTLWAQNINNGANDLKNAKAAGTTRVTNKYVDLINAIKNSEAAYADGSAKYTYASWNNFVAAYNAAKAHMASLNPAGSNVQYSSDATAIGNLATALDNARNALEERTYDVTYENMFSFSSWANSASSVISTPAKGTMTYDVAAGTITVNNNGANTQDNPNDHYTSYGFGNGHYNMTLVPGETYTFEYTTSGGSGDQVHIFFYDDNGNAVANKANSGNPFANAYGTGRGTHTLSFTAPENATKAAFRFGSTVLGDSITFSNIFMYSHTRGDYADIANWTYRPNRTVFDYNEALGSVTLDVPVRTGYTFDGWWVDSINPNGQKDEGEQVTDGNGTVVSNLQSFGIVQDWVLHSEWTVNKYTVMFDNMFDFSNFAINTGELTIDKRTDTGFTVTSASGTDANTGFSYAIPVEPGKTYILSADVAFDNSNGSGGYDMYVHTVNSSKEGETTATPDTANGAHREGNVYISLTGQTTETKPYIRFTAGENTAYVRIRFDANAAGNVLTVNNIRLNEADKVEDGISYHLGNDVTYDSAYGTLPTPTREGYTFAGWVDANGNSVTATTTVGTAGNHTLYSTWTINTYTVTFNYADGTAGSQQYDYGTTIIAPANTEKAPDATNHYTYTWSPSVSTTVTGDETYTEVLSTEAHSWSEWQTTTDSTCTAYGSKTRSCTVCGYTETAAINKKEHTEEIIPAVSATCSSTGLTEGKKCSVCGEILVAQTETQKLAHTEEILPAVESTCANTGLTEGKKCSVCGEILVAQQTTDKKAHSMGDWSQTKAPTCITDGTKQRECANCTYIETEAIPATGVHVYGEWKYERGSRVHTGKCIADSNCSEVVSEDHSFTEDIQPKEGSTSFHDYKCSVCTARGANVGGNPMEGIGEDCYIKTEVEPIEGNNSYHKVVCECGREKEAAHSKEVLDVAKEPTCTEKGSQQERCTICSYTFTSELPALGHDFAEEFTVDTKATCDTAGSKSKHCSRCSATTEVTEIPARGHNVVDDGVKTAATCTTDGVMNQKCNNAATDEYEACTYTTTRVIPATGHSFGATTAANPATCTEAGNEAYKQCTVCNLYFAGDAATNATDGKSDASSFVIAQKSHSYIGAIKSDGNGKEATHSFKCVNGCNNYGAAVKHIWNDGVIDPDSTCITGGTKTYTCTAEGCGATYTEDIAAKGHTFGATTAANPATCTEAGNEAYKQCTVCNLYFAGDAATNATDGKSDASSFVIAKLAHSYTGEYQWNGTATPKTHLQKCVNGCNEYGNETECTFDSVVTAPTCYAQGYTTHTCTVCTGSYKDTYTTRTHVYVYAAGNGTSHAVTCQYNDCDYTATENCSGGTATCTDKALCENCGAEWGEKNAANHTGEANVIKNYKKETCSAEGYSGDIHWSCCDALETKGTVISKLAHTEATREENKIPASCGADGSYTLVTYCSVCTAVIKEEAKTIPATGEHNYVTETDREEPTCQNEGYYVMACGCGATEKYTLETVDHKYETYTSNNNATCQNNATETAKCSFNCGETHTREIANSTVGHKYTTYTSDNNAKCEVDGTKTAFCDYGCGTKDTVTDIGSALVHKDEDKNHVCDNGCDVIQGEHEDNDKNHVCDYGCSEAMGDCTDENKDHACDYGCDKYYGAHVDENKDHACDYGCSVTIGDCEDKDYDHDCDYGCDAEFGEHVDNDKNHTCDYGCKEAIGDCEDEDKDHNCDYGCGKNDFGAHEDTDKDHACDYGCSETIGDCEDKDYDHDCDYGCGKEYGTHEDTNNDHKCEYGCSVAIGVCEDGDKDHKCDYGCGKEYGTHEDTNNDHKCEYGCLVAIGDCEDKDYDHACDYGCGKEYGEHVDSDKNHACDYGCSVAMGDCTDENKDHACDYGCDKYYGAHVDENKDHACDYGCSVTIGDCEDKDYDHDCDYGCDAEFGEHVDNDKNHTCDYGCKEAIGDCEDEDKDHNCDYGCGKNDFGAHEDTDKDHACDYGCSETIGDCEDEDKDHNCDYGCGKNDFGEHVDSDKNHVCDYGCSVAIGTHADSAEDTDHVCDYGCGAILEECSESEWITRNPATCEGKGEQYKVCTICNTELKKEDIPAINHDWDKTKSEDNLTRPALVDGVWTKGYYTYTCKNDSNHTTKEEVDRADYTGYETARDNLEALLGTDITDEAKQAIEDILEENEVADNLIESEQDILKDAEDALKDAFDQYKGSLKTYTVTFIVDGETVKTETVISGKDAKAPADPTKAYDSVNHYEFEGWDNAFTNVTSDVTVTAQFTEIAHTYTHTDKDDQYHTDTCDCGYSVDVEHTETSAVTTKASCFADGVRTYTCTVCGGTRTEVIAKREHNIVDTTVAQAPTCSATGIMNQKCDCAASDEYEACEYTTTRVMDKVADAHKWETEYTVDKKASCDEAGSKSYHCEYCDAINTDSVVEIAKREHNLVDTTVAKAPTCSATGIMNQKCDCEETAEYEACTYTTTRVMDKVADAHKWETEYTVDEKASCDKAGSKSYHCEYCDTINADSVVEIAKREHNLVDTTVAKAPTCSATGIMNQKCDCAASDEYEACEYTTTRVMDKVADAHKWETEYTVDKKASCDEAGSKSYHCEYCDTINTDSVVEIAKREHNLVDTTVALAPTCSATGIMNQKCDCAETAEYEACTYTTTRVMDKVADAHKWETEYTVDEKASCDKTGSKSYHCEYCDTINTDSVVEIAKREHNLVDTTVALAPTCSATGIMNQKCDCAETAEYEACTYTTTRVMDKVADAHKWETEYTVDEKASCDKAGSKSYHCEYCDTINADSVVEIAKREHNLVDTTVAKAPTCSATGIMNQKCDCAASDEYEACEYTTTRVIPVNADNHAGGTRVEKEDVVAGTCISAETWNEVTYCSDCNAKLSTVAKTGEKDANNHVNLVQVVAKEATCTEIGWNAYEYCDKCDYTTYVEIPVKAHDYKSVVTAPTCTDGGYTTYTCSCGDSYVADETAAEGHAWGEWIGEGDCTTTVVLTRTCSVCGETETKEVSGNSHSAPLDDNGNPIYDNFSEADCENGRFVYYKCTVCGAEVVEKGEALGHDITVEKVEPTCNKDGYTIERCSRCSYTLKTKIDKLGHTWIAKPDKAPTCDEDGYENYVECLTCGDVHFDVVSKTGHADNDGDGNCDGCNHGMYTGDCGCFCHSNNWFIKIVYAIIRFIWKVFGVHQICVCGTAHF